METQRYTSEGSELSIQSVPGANPWGFTELSAWYRVDGL